MSSSPEVLTGPVRVRTFVPGTVATTVGVEARAEGRTSGFVTGYATGFSEGLRRAAEAVAEAEAARDTALESALRQLNGRAGHLLLQLRAAAVQVQEDAVVDATAMADLVAGLAAELAEQVVLEAAPTAASLVARIRRGMSDAPVGSTVAVRVSPAGVGVLQRAGVLPDDLPEGVHVVADASLADGDVVVRVGAATVTDLLRPALAAALAELRGGTGA